MIRRGETVSFNNNEYIAMVCYANMLIDQFDEELDVMQIYKLLEDIIFKDGLMPDKLLKKLTSEVTKGENYGTKVN